ncbi:hypothetical protein [Ostreibacterium oceani]|uniref:Lipoprotein n=1 Tax=Ostreibacterium oceani TaxID=2654998 RepID=A0A6N7EWC0_9GAMM|nr:hypothetical protein [Ostreibacterium oceani]MPV85719.1 hypothetical protein [Ostreibacterium oceani]
MIKKVGIAMTVASIVSTSLLLGCKDEAPAAEVITEKALQRWDIRIAGKVYGLYDFLSPAQQKLYEREAYELSYGRGLNYLEADVQSIECNEAETACDVKVFVKYQYKDFPGGRPLDEKWVKENDDWWYFEAK